MADMDRKPLPKLSSEILEEITDAIVSGYDVSDLSRVLRFKWGFALRDYINMQQGFRFVVTDLVEWTERKGKAQELLVGCACPRLPEIPDLQAVAAKCGLSLQQVSQKYGTGGFVPRPASLEAMVNRHSRLIDYALFMQRLQDMGERICLVETPFNKGTGFLIGPDCALTNFHVVEDVIANKAPAAEVVCRFDFQAGDGRASQPCRLSADGIDAYSPYSESDLSANSEAEPDKLDYAVLRLAEPVASKCSDKPRGWFKLTADSPVIALRDFIVIPQHAEAQTSQDCLGERRRISGSGKSAALQHHHGAGSLGCAMLHRRPRSGRTSPCGRPRI